MGPLNFRKTERKVLVSLFCSYFFHFWGSERWSNLPESSSADEAELGSACLRSEVGVGVLLPLQASWVLLLNGHSHATASCTLRRKPSPLLSWEWLSSGAHLSVAITRRDFPEGLRGFPLRRNCLFTYVLELRKHTFSVSTVSHTKSTDLNRFPTPTAFLNLWPSPELLGENPAISLLQTLSNFCDSFDCRIPALWGLRMN